MCDRHSKALTHYCTEHGILICEQCATGEHSSTPCESMPAEQAAGHVRTKLIQDEAELKKLKGAGESILDGTRQGDTLRIITEAEKLFDAYVEDMKRKFNKAKMSLRPFTALSKEDIWKLKTITSKKIPKFPVKHASESTQDEAIEVINTHAEIKKQIRNANEVLQSLSMYMDVEISPKFQETINFEGKPIIVTRNGVQENSDDETNDRTISAFSEPQHSVYLIEKSTFTLEHCTDIAMMDDYIIASVGDSVQKRERKRMSFRQGITMPGAGILSVIGETSEVAVLQRIGCITVLETNPGLSLLFKIMIDRPYIDMCYFESRVAGRGLPKQSPVFVVCYRTGESYFGDFVDLVQAKSTRYPGNPPNYSMDIRTIAESGYGRNRSRFRGVSSVCVFRSTNIVVGSSKGLTCISKTGVLIWTIDLFRHVIHMLPCRTLIFVCIKDESRIMTVGKQGHVMEENVLPPLRFNPEKLCASNDVMMAKDSGKCYWYLFKQMFETTNDQMYLTEEAFD